MGCRLTIIKNLILLSHWSGLSEKEGMHRVHFRYRKIRKRNVWNDIFNPTDCQLTILKILFYKRIFYLGPNLILLIRIWEYQLYNQENKMLFTMPYWTNENNPHMPAFYFPIHKSPIPRKSWTICTFIERHLQHGQWRITGWVSPVTTVMLRVMEFRIS